VRKFREQLITVRHLFLAGTFSWRRQLCQHIYDLWL